MPDRIADRDAALALFASLAHARSEVAAFAFVGPEWRLLGLRHVPGGIDRVAVSLRQIARDALAFDAAGLIIAHNHPDGDPRPSEADRRFTRRLAQAMAAIDVVLFDHLVLAGSAVTSFRDLGML